MRQWIGSQFNQTVADVVALPEIENHRAAAFWTRCSTLRVDCACTPANRVAVVQSGGDECKHKSNGDFRAYATANLS